MRFTRSPIIAVCLALAMGALAGCMNREAPLSPVPPTARFSEAVAPVQLVFISRTYDSELDETTFLYQLQNTPDYTTGGGAQELSGILGVFTDVTVEIPSCAPALASYFPTDGATIGTTIAGFDGIEWGVGYDENPDYYYSMTFPGDIPSGTVRGLVETGGFTYVQNLVGPCNGSFQVAGSVFTDTNADGVQSLSELGIPDVTVKLTDGTTTQYFKTDSDGNYIFLASGGTWTVSVDSLTADADFNETLFQLFEATAPTSRQVTVGPDSLGNSFGFEPDVYIIIAGIEAGDYPTTGKSYKWWRKEFLRVLEGNTNTAYTEAELLAFVHEIEDLALLDEYDFTPGRELQEVYDILNNHTFGGGDGEEIEVTPKYNGKPDAYSFLVRELLTTELNHVSGRGLSDLLLQEILVNWGEGLLAANTPSSSYMIELPDGEMPSLIRSPLEDGGTLFSKLNGATGGGGTGD